jgi:hypothetical protein
VCVCVCVRVCVCVCVCVVYACVCVWCTCVCISTEIRGKGDAGESERRRVRQREYGREREMSQLTLEPMYTILGKALPRATRTRPSCFKAEPRWLSADFSPVWTQNVKQSRHTAKDDENIFWTRCSSQKGAPTARTYVCSESLRY